MILRRKRMPEDLKPAWAHFQHQAERVEQARQALLGCLPVGRVDPVPVPVGLDLLHDELLEVQKVVDAWRRPLVEEQWQACADALADALATIPAVHEVAVTTRELEELLDAVGDLIEPLGDAWAAAERHWLRLRLHA